jgi:hypothetical protein
MTEGLSPLSSCTLSSLRRVEDLDGKQINERYFANRTDGLRVGG